MQSLDTIRITYPLLISWKDGGMGELERQKHSEHMGLKTDSSWDEGIESTDNRIYLHFINLVLIIY